MRSGALRVCCVAAALFACGDRAPAQSPDVEATPPASELSGGAKPEHFLLYSGFDIWRFGRAGFGGFYASPEGLDKDGFMVRLFVSDGRERYDAGSKRFNTDILRGSLLPGARLSEGSFELKLFAGAEFESRMPDMGAATGNRSMSRIGARVAAETWWEPLPEIMLASSLSATTNFNAWSARGAAGWRAFDRFWAGPEILASGDVFSRQLRIGAHLTGFKLAAFEWSAATGFVQDSFGRSGVYGRLGVLMRQ
jgi:Cellulose biosynthesis protein BcsS